MKKNFIKKSVFLILASFLLSSCSYEVDKITKENVHSKDFEVYNNGSILKFKDQFTFNSAINEIKKSNDLQLKGTFTSLAIIFDKAMREAESYYDLAGGYEEFKIKYPSLYFPEEGDDYSAYLPVSDENVAKVLNKDGEVMIGDEVINMIDITSYKQIVDLGLTIPVDSGLILSDNSARLKWGSAIYTFGGDRRIWIKTRTYDGNTPIVKDNKYCFHIEVSFRKKGFLGQWYNYSSCTNLDLQNSALNQANQSQCGTSSHDYYIPYGPYGQGIVVKPSVGWGTTVEYLGNIIDVYLHY